LKKTTSHESYSPKSFSQTIGSKYEAKDHSVMGHLKDDLNSIFQHFDGI